MTITVSAKCFNLFFPFLASFILLEASNLKGFETIATVNISIDFEISAIIDEANVPIFSPISAITNAISAFSSSFLTCFFNPSTAS